MLWKSNTFSCLGRRGEHDIVLRVWSACLWGMEAGQLLGREGWVLWSGFRPKRAWKGQAAASACASTSTQQQLLKCCEMWNGCGAVRLIWYWKVRVCLGGSCVSNRNHQRIIIGRAGDCQQHCNALKTFSLADFVTANPWKGILPIRITTGCCMPSRNIVSCTCSFAIRWNKLKEVIWKAMAPPSSQTFPRHHWVFIQTLV